MNGVKIERSIAIAKIKLYEGFGLFSPCILDPSHSNKVGQNTTIIRGVPDPAKNKKGVERMIKHDDKRETLLLNHRFKRRISINPNNNPTMILGSLTLKVESPKNIIENFCNKR